jgi:hypothetical protein
MRLASGLIPCVGYATIEKVCRNSACRRPCGLDCIGVAATTPANGRTVAASSRDPENRTSQ